MKVNNICKDCIKLGNGCNGTTNPVWTGCVLRVTPADVARWQLENNFRRFETWEKV